MSGPPASGSTPALCPGDAADKAPAHGGVNLFSGMVSPADIRHLREIVLGFGLAPTILPDYSETLDGPALLEYENIPSGGTPLADDLTVLVVESTPAAP